MYSALAGACEYSIRQEGNKGKRRKNVGRIVIVALFLFILKLLYKKYFVEVKLEDTLFNYRVIRHEISEQYDSLPDEFFDKDGKKFIRSVDQYRLSWYHPKDSEDDAKEAKIPTQYYAYDGAWYALSSGSMGEILYSPVDEVPPCKKNSS